jgi:hypothetical protein
MKNPLYPFNLINTDNIQYNKCLVITRKHGNVLKIFDEDVDESYFQEIHVNYMISEIPMWIIKLIPEYKKKFVLFEVSEDDLLKCHFNGITLSNESIIYNLQNACILIPNHPWSWFHQHIEYYIKDGIQNMYKYVLNDNINTLTITNLINEMSQSYDVKYWSNVNKCKINITTPWLLRDINFSDAKEININQKKLMNDHCNDYLSNIINKNQYVDASSGIKTHKHTLYYVEEYSNLPVDLMINKLFDCPTISTEQKNTIITYCLISKKYVHRILKDERICKYLDVHFNTFSPSFAYSWLMMYLEEGILKSYIKDSDRCIFTLQQAKNLPFNNYAKSVYLPLLVDPNYVNIFGGYESSNNSKIELSSIYRFRERMTKFINKYDIDVFKNFNWKNIAISGSIISATCRNIDPMERDGSYTMEEFFNTYYKDSDVDVMCDAPDYVTFIDKINYMIETMKTNILEKFPLSENPIQYEISKNCALQLSKKYVDEHYSGFISPEDAYKIYVNMKNKEVKQLNSKYSKINEICTFDNFKYYIYNNDQLKEPTIGENIKYHIYSPYLTRKFEVFKIKYSFLATISRFHLPCVRGYYDGNEVYLLPSAVSALLTGKCIDYKYFAGVRSPFEIILKYIFRGYSIFFNKREMIKIVEYIKHSEKWSAVFGYNDTFKVKTFQSYYTNPFALLNKNDIKYYDYRRYIGSNLVSPVVSTFGYVKPI